MKGTRAPTAVLDFAPRAGLTGLTPLLLLDWTCSNGGTHETHPCCDQCCPAADPPTTLPRPTASAAAYPASTAARCARRDPSGGAGGLGEGVSEVGRGAAATWPTLHSLFALARRRRRRRPSLYLVWGVLRPLALQVVRRDGGRARNRGVSGATAPLGVPIGPLEEASDSAGLELSLFCAARRPRLSRPPPPTQTSLLRRSRRVVVCGAPRGTHNSIFAEIVPQMDGFGSFALRHFTKKFAFGSDSAARPLWGAKVDREP